MRFLRQSLTGLFLASTALGLLIYAASLIQGAIAARLAEDQSSPPARERIFAVGVETARAGTEVPVMRAFGEIRAERSLELRATAAGRLVELPGAFVEGGKSI